MQGQCRNKNVLYKCIVLTSAKVQRVCIGISEDEWNKPYYNHTKLLRSKHYKNATSLSS